MQENPLWQYSLAIYQRPGVQPLLLQLQDDFGADINMLLGCCWLAKNARALTDDELAALINASASWRAQCIMPLRAVRRYLKSQQHTDALYQRVKALELDAEQWQQDRMYQLLTADDYSASRHSADQLALHNLRQYCGRLPGVEWECVTGLIGELIVRVGLDA